METDMISVLGLSLIFFCFSHLRDFAKLDLDLALFTRTMSDSKISVSFLYQNGFFVVNLKGMVAHPNIKPTSTSFFDFCFR